MGRRPLAHILVVDVESTCWEGAPPPGQHSDIIEIGVCLLDLRDFQRHDKRSILVKPARSEVSAFCTELTTLRPEDVAEAGDLAEACKVLRKAYDARSIPWASYGDYDRNQFKRNCDALAVSYPFGPTHINVKTLFAITAGMKQPTGMAGALERLGLPLEGTHHRGHDDAWNIAAILGKVLAAGRGGLGLSEGGA